MQKQLDEVLIKLKIAKSNAPWRMRPDFLGPHEVGHKDVATRCGALSL